MFSFVTFLVSLILIALLFVAKGWEIYYGKNNFCRNFLQKCDINLLRFFQSIKNWKKHFNFRNVVLFFVWTTGKITSLVIYIKRRFDHKQSRFFIKNNQHSSSRKKGAVSFFLKDVSDYKKSLRGGSEK